MSLSLGLSGNRLSSVASAIVNSFSGDIFAPSDQTCYTTDAMTTLCAKDEGVGGIRGLLGRFTVSIGTAGFEAVLRKGAKSLSTYSEDWRNTADAGETRPTIYSRVTLTPNAAVAPDGTTTADKIVEDATATNTHYVRRSYGGLPDNLEYTVSRYLKAAERTWVYLAFLTKADVAGKGAYFNLSTGTVGTVESGATAAISESSPGSGIWRCSVTRNIGSGAGTPACDVRLATGDGGQTYSGDGSSGVYVWGEQFELGSTTSTYVATTTTPASNGIGLWWLDDDGSDDRRTVSAVPFQMSEDHCVVASVRNLSKTTARTVFSIGSSASNTPRVCEIGFTTNGYAYATWIDDAATTATITGSTDLTGQDVVISATKQGNDKKLFVNGVQIGSTESTAMGTTTVDTARFGATAIATPSQFFNGREFSGILMKGTVSDSQRYLVERYAGMLAGKAI